MASMDESSEMMDTPNKQQQTAEKLSFSETEKTVRFLSSKKKMKRVALASPYKKIWPKVAEEDEKRILDVLQRVIEPLCVGNLKEVSYPEDLNLTRRQRQSFKKKARAAYREKGKPYRPLIAIGINDVTRNAEKKCLVAALVSRNVIPGLMTEHLMHVCSRNEIPIAAITDLGTTLPQVLNFKRCIAIGFKKGTEQTEHPFREVHEMISQIAPPLETTTDVEVANILAEKINENNVEVDTKDAEAEDVKETEKTPDSFFSRFYVLKEQHPKRLKLEQSVGNSDLLSLTVEPESSVKLFDPDNKSKNRKRKCQANKLEMRPRYFVQDAETKPK